MTTITRGTGRRLVALACALVALGGLVSAPSSQAQGPVRIGFIYPDSGPFTQLGTEMRDGFQLYWSQVGSRAGGRPVEVLPENKGSNKADEGLTKARKLVERDRVHVLAGIVATPVALALRSYVIDQKVPLIITNAGSNAITQKLRSEYIFRSSFSNSDGSHPLGEWAYKQGYRRAVIMVTDFTAGYEYIGGFARTFTEAGGRIVQEIYAPLGTADFAPYLTQVRTDADVVAAIFFGADAVRFVKQYAEFGLKQRLPLIGRALTLEDLLPAQGDAAEGVVTAFHWSAALDTPENKRFVEAYMAKHRRTPSPLTEQGYLGAMMIARALETVKGNVENQEAFLAALRAFEGDAPRGRVKLDAYQNPIHTMYILKVEKKGGALVNTPIASYPNTGQFWKWTPEAFLAMPAYAEMRGKWAR